MVIEFVKYVVAGMSVGFQAFLSTLPLYQELNGIKEQIIATGLHIPAIVVSFIFLLAGACKFIYAKIFHK